MRAQDLMDRAKKLMGDKGDDYTKDPGKDQFENFDRVATIASWFNDPIDLPFAVLIGTKLARLATLLNGKSPKNESILDSFLDLTNYSALWGGRRCSDSEQRIVENWKAHMEVHKELTNQDKNLARSEQAQAICYFCGFAVSGLMYESSITNKKAHVSCYNGRSYDAQCKFVSGSVG